MNKCLYCGEPVKNKFCNTSCQNKKQNSKKSDKIYGKNIKFIVLCNNCKTEFSVEEREKLFPKKKKYFCSVSCSNSRNWSDDDKKNISESLLKSKKINHKTKTICGYCNKEFEHYISKKRKFCSQICSNSFNNKQNIKKAIKGGKKSAFVQSENRRSKNEIYFADLCEKHFKYIRTNKPIFNGWDADIILDDYKIAILWNGKWHYEKITKKHSVKQVQNRDKIKIEEITKFGYIPYIIKDMGRENKEFVKEKFKELKNKIKELKISKKD